MLNRILFGVLFFFVAKEGFTQFIKLERINSLEVVKIKLPCKKVLKYKKGNELITKKEFIVKYEYPYLFTTNNNDTNKIMVNDVLSISRNSVSKNVFSFLGGSFTGLLTIPFFLQGTIGKQPAYLIVAGIGGFFMIKQLNAIKSTLDTENVWSFY